MQTVDDVARELHEKLLLRGEETKQLQFESIHVSLHFHFRARLNPDSNITSLTQRETDETKHNVETFVNAPDLQSAKPLLQKVRLSLLPSLIDPALNFTLV